MGPLKNAHSCITVVKEPQSLLALDVSLRLGKSFLQSDTFTCLPDNNFISPF